jgi:hypothetical protein
VSHTAYAAKFKCIVKHGLIYDTSDEKKFRVIHIRT